MSEWESVLPAQFFDERVDERGRAVRALMAAVLQDAVDRFAGRRSARQGSRTKLAREAERWIRSEDWRWPFSFNNICLALGLSPARLRVKILRRTVESHDLRPPRTRPAEQPFVSPRAPLQKESRG